MSAFIRRGGVFSSAHSTAASRAVVAYLSGRQEPQTQGFGPARPDERNTD
jgi:hypothetical protein